ncbi:MAG TPA: pyrroloquinoline quinone-dependent dehydrogenase, partial [Blastocatellia bacterium]|nr:pyrroloquinoline quinone-dependent dehydrogenase [Blastocatellia bacterium]
NFSSLKIAWRWKTADAYLSKTIAGGEWWSRSKAIFDDLQKDDPNRWRDRLAPRIGSLKATPLMVGGTLYVVTPLYQAAAIDAATGETMWVYNPKSYEAGTPTMSLQWNQRGAAYWTDGKEARIFWGTGDGYLIAVDAKTGRPCADFGENGRVDMMKDIPRVKRGERDYLNALKYSLSSPPIVCRDVVIAGSLIADRIITKEAPPGDVQAWDVRTGRLKWRFHTVPREGEFGVETWENDSWKYSGNCNVWSMMSADDELGYVYLPTGTPTNDFYGGHRLGDNLFADSLICVDVETGKRVWHFQTVHHGLWDYDNPAAPNLVDITVEGKRIKAVALVTKQGFCFVFDRATGEPVWPIQERAVPPSDMPGEKASPTQPFPTKPPPFEYQGVSVDDLIDFTPELRAEAEKVIKRFRIGPLFTPPSLAVPGGTQGTIMRPGIVGGANWEGAAVDPETGFLYVPSRNAFSIVHFYTPSPEKGGTLRYTHGERGEYPRGPQGLPLFKPPYSRMTAIDLNRGEIAWMTPIGNGSSRIRNHPLLKGVKLPPLGGAGARGPLLTKTLLISAWDAEGVEEGEGPKLVAYDKATGKIVGSARLPGNAIGTPMTYMLNGKQYIALTVDGSPPELIALSLP